MPVSIDMVSSKLTKLQQRNVLFDDSEDDEILDELGKDNVGVNFLFPIVGESYKVYADSYMDMELLERGERDLQKFQESINGQVLQPIFELMRTNSLTPETLESNSDKWSKDSAESKYMFLKRRYYVDADKVVRDRRKGERIVCEPICIFDLIMCAHLMNDHMTYRPIHDHLNKMYSNITREFTKMTVKYCSVCNPDQHLKPIEKYRHKNIFKGALPLERVHVEVFEPFDGELIANSYSYVLYCRDYHTRFVWLLPLKNTKFKHLISAMGTLILGMIRTPMYIESSTLDKQDLFDICEYLCGKYGIKLGLGVNSSSQFHANGIRRMKKLLNERKEACISDWNYCLKYGPYYLNRVHNTLAVGVPSDLLYSCSIENSKEYSLKQEKIIDESSAQNVVHVKKGLIYLEGESAQAIDEGESDAEEDQDNMRAPSATPSFPAPSEYPGGNSPTPLPGEDMGDMHPSSEISEPSTSFYDELISPSKKRLRLAPKMGTA